jgi:uroporphyrinogen decarboxylase
MACRREPVDVTPVWFMRQAGRYMAEYRELRTRHSLLEICRTPDLATEVTLQPIRRLDVDAAIIFSDLLLPLEPMGLPFDFVAGEGPQLEHPIEGPEDIDRLTAFEPREALAHVLEAIRQVQSELAGRLPLIGFAGAPFTLASYLIEGKPSRDHARTKALLHREPETWRALMVVLTDHVILPYLRAQVAAGVHAIQLFDSWAGALDPDDYREHVLPWSRRILEGLGDAGVPLIHFGTGTGELLAMMREAGADVVGVDWRTPLDTAWDRIGADAGIQGNLDPAALLGPWEVVERKAEAVLARAGGRPGHVFNLGHGVFPETPPEHLARLVELVHERTTR